MSDTSVDRLYSEAKEILSCLDHAGQVSLGSAAQDQFRKAVLLASASYFENILSGCVNCFASEFSNSDLLVYLVQNKVVSRQYHTWFNWEAANANSFFALFGPEFKTRMSEKYRSDTDYQGAVRAFLELGSTRNSLVHQDYATFALDKTLDEVYDLYKRAIPFVESFAHDLRA